MKTFLPLARRNPDWMQAQQVAFGGLDNGWALTELLEVYYIACLTGSWNWRSLLALLSNVLNIFIQSLRWGGMYISYILHHFVGLYTCSPQEFCCAPKHGALGSIWMKSSLLSFWRFRLDSCEKLKKIWTAWQFIVTFLGWLSDPFEG